MKIEVGMYVRTDLGEIAKVVAESSYWVNIDKFKKDDITLRIVKKIDILKASHNIIDLIEVGDYVNGYRVIAIIDCELRVDGFSWGTNIIKDYDIETVVTHEQFESMAYKVVK